MRVCHAHLELTVAVAETNKGEVWRITNYVTPRNALQLCCQQCTVVIRNVESYQKARRAISDFMARAMI